MRPATISLAALLAVTTIGATACGNDPAPPPAPAPAWDGTYAAVGVCGTVAEPVMRVDDDACPAGDAIVPDWPYQWYYLPISPGETDVDIVFVGMPLDTDPARPRHYVRERPPQIRSALQVARGVPRDSRSAQVATGSTAGPAPSSAKVAQRQPSPTVQRGGLGTPQARNVEAPRPNRSLDSPAPGRAASPAPAKAPTAAAPAPRVAPPAPPAVRIAPPSVKVGR